MDLGVSGFVNVLCSRELAYECMLLYRVAEIIYVCGSLVTVSVTFIYISITAYRFSRNCTHTTYKRPCRSTFLLRMCVIHMWPSVHIWPCTVSLLYSDL
jgi:hypothetical protein